LTLRQRSLAMRWRAESDSVGLPQIALVDLNHRKEPSGVPEASGLADVIRV